MSAQRNTEQSKPLCHSVSESVEEYLGSLNGQVPSDLYNIILEQVEPPLLRAVLTHCGHNQSRAAEVLGLNRATLRKKLRHHKIQTKPF